MLSIQREQTTQTHRDGQPYKQYEASDDEALETEDLFDILSNSRRRLVLYHLKCNGSASDLRTLTRQIAAWENDVEPEQVSNQQRMRAYTALRQSHLPKMDRKGLIDFDADRGTVKLREPGVAMDDYLRDVFDHGHHWGYVFAGIGLVGFAASLGHVLELPVLAGVPGILIAVIVSTAVLITVGFKRVYERYVGEVDRNIDYL